MAKPVRGSTAKHKGVFCYWKRIDCFSCCCDVSPIHVLMCVCLFTVCFPSPLGKATPIFTFKDGRCEVMLTLDLKEGTLRFTHQGRSIGTIAAVKGPVHAAVTVTTSKQTVSRKDLNGYGVNIKINLWKVYQRCIVLLFPQATILPGPIGDNEHSNEELVHVLRAKGCQLSPRMEAAMLLVPRDLFVPRDRHREAFRCDTDVYIMYLFWCYGCDVKRMFCEGNSNSFNNVLIGYNFRDNKVAMRMADGSTMTLPPPSFVVNALEHLELRPGQSFLDVGCGTGYVSALAACLLGDRAPGALHGVECVSSRLEQVLLSPQRVMPHIPGIP